MIRKTSYLQEVPFVHYEGPGSLKDVRAIVRMANRHDPIYEVVAKKGEEPYVAYYTGYQHGSIRLKNDCFLVWFDKELVVMDAMTFCHKFGTYRRVVDEEHYGT